MTKKKGKGKKIIIIAVVAVVAVLVVAGYFGWRQRLADAEKTTYQVVSVTRGDVEVKVKGSGTVEPLEDHTVYAGVSGTVKQVNAEDGDTVSAGDVIAVLKSDDLESQRDSLQQQIDDIDKTILTLRSTTGRDAIYSSVKGVVKTVYAKKGDSVDAVMDEYGALAVVCPDERMKTVIDADGLKTGDEVTVTVGSQSVSGVVTDAENGTASVSFEDDDFLPEIPATVTAEDGTVLGEGTVQVENPVYITGRGGTVDKVRKDVGDKVSRGNKMFDLDGEILSTELYDQLDQRADLEDDLSDVQTDIDALTIYAGTDGVVSDLDLNEEQLVQEGAPLFCVQSSDSLKIDVDIDELDIAGIEPNEKAAVTFDALPDQIFEGEIVKINPIGVAENDVTNYTVTLSLANAKDVMIGMSADVTIISQKAENVLTIPAEAIQIINGEKYVVMASDLNQKQDTVVATHKVTTGITDGVNIEIKEGLAEGDQVAVPQVKDSVEDQMMNFRQAEKSSSPSE